MFVESKDIANIYLHIKPVNFRKGIYGLGSHVDKEFENSKKQKNLFVFCNKSKNKIRILYWDYTGYALWHKALESDTFKWPKHEYDSREISDKELRYLLSGLNIEDLKPHKNKDAKPFY